MTLLRDLATIQESGTSHDASILKRVLLSRKDAVANIMQLAVSVLEPGQCVQSHAHTDLWEVFLVQAGCVRFTIDGVEYQRAKGQLLVVEPLQAHAVACCGDVRAKMLVVGMQGDPPQMA